MMSAHDDKLTLLDRYRKDSFPPHPEAVAGLDDRLLGRLDLRTRIELQNLVAPVQVAKRVFSLKSVIPQSSERLDLRDKPPESTTALA
jgi:hypothetical protein